MACFRCCGAEAIQQATDRGRPFTRHHSIGNYGGYRASDSAPNGIQSVKVHPIAVPAIPVEELSEITDKFGTNSLIGEGLYGSVYYGVLKTGKSTAIKKLEPNKQPDKEFWAQVWKLVS
ncbi:pto-interacting protein 1-like [Asparagus officinalis]|uniref:pto-interacting protein 1-like n=1 Tax=Asparagus officinalis TaxID=4686 RepID=UPI00098DFDCA|nr:pto-interacting protein 1-like [Asparagus officinalis]